MACDRRARPAGGVLRAGRLATSGDRSPHRGDPVRRQRARGTGLVDLLVGTALALAVLSVLTAAVGTGARVLVAGGARGEAEDTAQLAVEAFTFDARRAGWDPRAVGIAPLVEATPSRVTFTADLDANGAVDASSEEKTAHVCTAGVGRLSRIIGRQ